MDDEALSPVVATILLFAIAVAMAGSVWLAVYLLTEDSDAPTLLIGEKSEVGDSWQLVKGPDTDQSAIFWRGDAGVRYAFDARPDGSSPLVPAEWSAIGGDEVWPSGRTIRFCSDGPEARDWSFELQEREQRHTFLGEVHFMSITPC